MTLKCKERAVIFVNMFQNGSSMSKKRCYLYIWTNMLFFGIFFLYMLKGMEKTFSYLRMQPKNTMYSLPQIKWVHC